MTKFLSMNGFVKPTFLAKLASGLLAVSLFVGAFIGVFGTAPALASGSGGGAGGIPTAPAGRDLSPEQQAEKAYKAGLKYKERAWKAEEKAQTAKSQKAQAKQLKRADKAYVKAQSEFAKVLQILPEHYKAANELGYVLRKQGQYKKAIGAYNYALQLYPEFLQAVEYRGEAFLAIGYYDEAKKAYMQLFRSDSELAEELMVSMRNWRIDIEANSQPPSARARNFIEWLDQRQNVSAFGEVTESTSSGW